MSEYNCRCWAEIDVNALLTNYHTALSFLRGGARLICVLKANAYGLGAVKVAELLSAEGADFFAVACMAEARELKQAVPERDVMILGLVTPEEAREAIAAGIILTVYSKKSAAMVARIAAELKITARIQLKVDTGLHRIGFDPSEVAAAIEFARSPYIKIEGLYTHLALRDAENDARQFARLEEFDRALQAAGIDGYIVHACDSIGMVRYPEKHLGAVRTGAWLYGVCPYRYEHPELCLPTVTFKAQVSQLRRVEAGECIGYDEEHPLERDSIVATLSAGYVDGFPRLNNEGYVLIRGQKARVLGLVCMDQMMVDVTDIPGAAEGDEAILLGGGITVDEYAKIAQLNRNEALSRLGRRVPRIYCGVPEA